MQQNLARAWRSKNFDEIVGQELTVRLLKNSLAKNSLFPVYLFSGLRGSGKTSTGRIFAAAINCHALKNFQNNSQQILPCATCASCVCMRAGNHPDFIEIDAASHTGVDNIRQIIESASFLPVMGVKKVYLIDEAHMLSKAAFNAFLKILEEPPATVVFLLATTEVHKILDTVISRSFQLFFDPIPQPKMIAHLKHICQVEQIHCEEFALALIAQQSEGSLRDALTTMERVALAEGDVTYEGTHRALGLVHDAVIVKLFEIIALGNLDAVFEYLIHEQFERHSPKRIWDKIVAVLRALLWSHHGGLQHVSDYALNVSTLKSQYSSTLVLELFELFYKAEAHFLKTSSQQVVLEALICKMVQRFDCRSNPSIQPPMQSATQPARRSLGVVGDERVRPVLQQSQTLKPHNERKNFSAQGSFEGNEQRSPHSSSVRQSPLGGTADVSKGQSGEVSVDHVEVVLHVPQDNWQKFLKELETKNNPIATSIFKQGNFVRADQDAVYVCFAKKFEFYHDWMLSHESLWRPPLESVFGSGVAFAPEFVVAPVSAVDVSVLGQGAVVKTVAPEVQRPLQQDARSVRNNVQEKIDISDAQKWRTANMVTEMFPGTITTRKDT